MLIRTITVIGVALALAGCIAAPIYNVQDQAVTAPSGHATTAAEVRTAILAAGGALGWQVKDLKPGVMEATLVLRTHTAVVEIPYSAKAYSIVYKSSINLTEANGSIHKNYNGWIHNLQNSINARLSALS